MLKKKNILKTFTLFFFLVSFFEVVAEFYSYKPAILFLKSSIPLTLILMYLIESQKKNVLYVLLMFFSLITNLLFIPDSAEILLYALIAFMVHRILILYLVFKLNKITDFIPMIIATTPFLIVFFYIFFETPDLPPATVPLVVIHNILMAVFAGISLSSYVMNDNKQNSILLISVMLFVVLQFSVFIEKYYLNDEYLQILRPLSMSLNSIAFYSFFRYVIEAEKSNNN